MATKVTPSKSILDPTFKYTSSVHTDIRKRFEEARKRLEYEPHDDDCSYLDLHDAFRNLTAEKHSE